MYKILKSKNKTLNTSPFEFFPITLSMVFSFKISYPIILVPIVKLGFVIKFWKCTLRACH